MTSKKKIKKNPTISLGRVVIALGSTLGLTRSFPVVARVWFKLQKKISRSAQKFDRTPPRIKKNNSPLNTCTLAPPSGSLDPDFVSLKKIVISLKKKKFLYMGVNM